MCFLAAFCLYLMLASVDWVLIIFGTQVIKKNRPVRLVFPDYLSVSYDYAWIDSLFTSLPTNDFARIGLMIKSIFYQTNRKSFLLNTITGVKFIQSVFSHCKLHQSEVTKKRLLTINNIETNKINKKRKTLMICYT